MRSELERLCVRLPALQACADRIEAGYALLRDAFAAGGQLLLCGNGGSAADAEHWAAELLKGFDQTRPLSAADRAGLPPELAGRLQGALPAIPLTGFGALRTAFANDVGENLGFAQLVWALGRRGDVLAALSTSGNSVSVLAAVRAAKAKGLRVLGLTAQGGGELAALADVCIRAPASETHLAQELHLPIYHCLCLMLEAEFFKSA